MDWWRQSGFIYYIYLFIMTFSFPRFQKAFLTVSAKEVLLISKGEFTLFDIWSQLDRELQVEKAYLGM